MAASFLNLRLGQVWGWRQAGGRPLLFVMRGSSENDTNICVHWHRREKRTITMPYKCCRPQQLNNAKVCSSSSEYCQQIARMLCASEWASKKNTWSARPISSSPGCALWRLWRDLPHQYHRNRPESEHSSLGVSWTPPKQEYRRPDALLVRAFRQEWNGTCKMITAAKTPTKENVYRELIASVTWRIREFWEGWGQVGHVLLCAKELGGYRFFYWLCKLVAKRISTNAPIPQITRKQGDAQEGKQNTWRKTEKSTRNFATNSWSSWVKGSYK